MLFAYVECDATERVWQRRHRLQNWLKSICSLFLSPFAKPFGKRMTGRIGHLVQKKFTFYAFFFPFAVDSVSGSCWLVALSEEGSRELCAASNCCAFAKYWNFLKKNSKNSHLKLVKTSSPQMFLFSGDNLRFSKNLCVEECFQLISFAENEIKEWRKRFRRLIQRAFIYFNRRSPHEQKIDTWQRKSGNKW